VPWTIPQQSPDSVDHPSHYTSHPSGVECIQVVEHMSHDSLVGWAWTPGPGRSPAPGTQAQLAALLDAWVATGAACPVP
jgi:hypothetical protein